MSDIESDDSTEDKLENFDLDEAEQFLNELEAKREKEQNETSSRNDDHVFDREEAEEEDNDDGVETGEWEYWETVESESREDVTHGLHIKGGEAVYCTCEAYEYLKGPCKHIEQFNAGDSR